MISYGVKATLLSLYNDYFIQVVQSAGSKEELFTMPYSPMPSLIRMPTASLVSISKSCGLVMLHVCFPLKMLF